MGLDVRTSSHRCTPWDITYKAKAAKCEECGRTWTWVEKRGWVMRPFSGRLP